MNTSSTEPLVECLDAHLDIEQAVVNAVQEVNEAMAAVLKRSGIQGPSETDLLELEPHLNRLREQGAVTRRARQDLSEQFECGEKADAMLTFSRLSRQLPATFRDRLEQRRAQVRAELADAQATLASNQVLVYYSMDFHRRYLMGVLESEEQATENASYSADGQAFSPQPETLFGRNC
ncbi:MAG: hypothetical protein AAFV88_04290 [Planctomycetota bacterium]